MNKLKKFFSGYKVLMMVLFVGLVSLSPNASAAENWIDVLKSGSDLITAGKTFIVMVAYGLGTLLFFLGLWWVYKDGKEENRGHMKNGITALIIGSFLLVFPQVIGWTVSSTGADDISTQSQVTESFAD